MSEYTFSLNGVQPWDTEQLGFGRTPELITVTADSFAEAQQQVLPMRGNKGLQAAVDFSLQVTPEEN